MSIAYEGVVAVRAGIWTLALPGHDYPMHWEVPFANQVNGLLDASAPLRLRVVTGTIRGDVPVVVEVLPGPPDATAEGADVVEASITAPERTVEIRDGADTALARQTFESAGPFRVRYTVTGLDAGRRQQVVHPGASAPDRCLLQLWPAPAAADEVLQVSGAVAAGWHAAVAAAPHVLTDAERAELDRAEQERANAEFEERMRKDELERWGGRLPGPRVGSAGWALDVLARPDRSLLDVIEDLPDDGCRRVALAVVSHLVMRTRLDDVVPSASSALDDIAAGRPAPAPFRSTAEALAAAGGPPPPPPPPPPPAPAGHGGRSGVYVSVGAFGGRARTPVQETAMAVAALGRPGTGWDALWFALQTARDVADRTDLAAVVRAALPTT